jgi:hypothetical protein
MAPRRFWKWIKTQFENKITAFSKYSKKTKEMTFSWVVFVPDIVKIKINLNKRTQADEKLANDCSGPNVPEDVELVRQSRHDHANDVATLAVGLDVVDRTFKKRHFKNNWSEKSLKCRT